MKDLDVLDKIKTDVDTMKKALCTDANVGKDPLRGILNGLEIPDEVIEKAKETFSNPKIKI